MSARDGQMSTAAVATRVTMLLLATVIAVLMACAGIVHAQSRSALSGPAEGDLSDQYIVVLKEGVGQASERVASE